MKHRSEAIGKLKIVGGEFDGIEVEFMGFETNMKGELTGLFLCLEYFAIALPLKFIDFNNIEWYSKIQEILALEYKRAK